jgi:hypothetical protein
VGANVYTNWYVLETAYDEVLCSCPLSNSMSRALSESREAREEVTTKPISKIPLWGSF